MKNFTILIIDDSVSFSLYLQEILFTNGYKKVLLSHSFESAQEILSNENIQLVILDIELNKQNKEEGFLLGKFIKNNYDIPIIFITAKQEEEIKSLLDINIYNFDLYALLYKPFQFTELEILIQTLIKNHQEKKIQEQSYQKLVEYINYPTIILNKTKILYQNQNFIKFINSFKKNDIFSIVPELENIIKEIYKKSLQEFKYSEFKINTYDNKKLKIEVIPLTKEYLQIIFYDENKNNSLKEKENPFSSLLNLFDKILEGILIIDSKRNIIYVNQTFLKMFQYEEKEILNKNVKVLKNTRYPLRYYLNI